MAGETNTGQVKWTHMAPSHAVKRDAGPKYSRFGERIRHVTPGALQCSMFCGGKQCKYENPNKIKTDEMAIKGLYSSWITKNILATARPSSEVIKSHCVLEQFKDLGIKSIINLQHPGEHASCGYGLQDSGFSYDPEAFMQVEIFFYNFGWNDYGVRSLESILDMVKVMSFALQEGKTAVHCHAGLGRTGVLICCYFIYSDRLTAEEAIHLMRKNRPKAVQTRGQIECVKDFYKFLSHLWVIFPSSHSEAKQFTLENYLKKQRHLLHGMEARELRNIPKIVFAVCSRLLELASVKSEEGDMTWKLPSDAKKAFSEKEEPEETEMSADCTDTGKKLVKDFNFEREDTETELKHNPYVENRVDPKAQECSLQRSQSTEDVINDVRGIDAPHLVRRLSALGSHAGLSRAHSESDLTVPQCFDVERMPRREAPLGKPAIHGVRLEPLNVCVEKKKKKSRKSSKSTNDETKVVNADSSAENNPKNVVDSGISGTVSCGTVTASTSTQSTEEDRVLVAKALATSACADHGVHNRTEKLKRKLNASDSGWEELRTEGDPWVLSRLLWTWLEELACPVLSESDIEGLCDMTRDPIKAVKQLPKGTRDTLECLFTTMAELLPLPSADLEDRALRRLSMVLTQNRVLSLTNPRASFDRMASNSSEGLPESSPEGGGDEDDGAFTDNDSTASMEYMTSSPSYKLLLFLRELMGRLKETRPSSRP